MGEIQTFREEHAGELASLFMRVMRGQSKPPADSLAKYFCEILLTNPWASPEIPSLVYLEGGKVVGSLGVIPRPAEFRGEPITVAVATQFMVDPEYRQGHAALQLLRRFFRGPQHMSWTDGAADAVGGLWLAMGAHTAPLFAFNWIRILRPFGTAGSGLDRGGAMARRLRGASALLTTPADLLLSKLPIPVLREPVSPFLASEVPAEGLLACIQEIGWREPLRPAYSLPSFSWLMSQAATAAFGQLRMLTVTNREGTCCGWFVYYAKKGAPAFVLQVGVRRRDYFPGVLQALFRDAWQQGASSVRGQSLPKYLTALTEQHCIFRHPNGATLVHSKNADISTTVRLGDAALTRLDGECWLRFAGEPWDRASE